MCFESNRFEEIASSDGQQDNDEDDTEANESDGIIRSTRKKKAPREHVRKISCKF
jgi:hypothetical protein